MYVLLILISVIILASFMIAYIGKFGIPTSISKTYTKIERKLLFYSVIGISTITAIIPMFALTPIPIKFLVILAVFGLIFNLLSPLFKENVEKKIHLFSSIVAGVSLLTWLILMSGIPFVAIVGCLIAGFDKKRFAFWMEAGLTLNLYSDLLNLTIPYYLP